MTTTHDSVRERAARAGQDHVFRFWDELDEAGRERLVGQVAAVDFELVERLAALLEAGSNTSEDTRFEPPELFPLERDAARESQAREAFEEGEALLGAGRVAYLLVAGGQASRLGYDGPKGDFPVGPVSGRTLFEIHARRLLAAREKYGAPCNWYVMTSPANDAATRAIFAEHGWYGLAPEDVFFFTQEMLPALDSEGRILMAAKDCLFLAPNGHGGTLWALSTSGALEDMRRRGLDIISYFQVDNPLARPADPTFLGLHALAGAGMSSKVVKKRGAGEKVGVLGRVDGVLGCIEYSDLPEQLREAHDASGELLFGAGNIAVHALGRAFVEELTQDGLDLPWHLAHKQMQVMDQYGRLVERAGTKFETFVFDALHRSPSSVTLEVDRGLEFSPLKNAVGEDSPATCRADLCRLWAGWVRKADLALPDADEDGVHPVEVDPLVAESEAEFLAAEKRIPEATGRGHLYG